MSLLPVCPRTGHDQFRVSRDGTYGKRRRQLFRCTDPSGVFHRFVPPVPRQRAESGVCDLCDNQVHVHQGPVALPNGLYEVREIAEALVSISKGLSYTETARRVRGRYWGTSGKTRRAPGTVEGGQTVADWLNQFGPVILEAYEETHWPETVVLDGTSFLHTNARTGVSSQLFNVLCAWGYEAGDKKGRLWQVKASPSAQGADWQDFLSALPGKPVSVVCDADKGLVAGVKAHWGRGRGGVLIHQCEHHMWKNGMKALKEDGHAYYGNQLSGLLSAAFKSPGGWQAFAQAVQTEPVAPATQKWVKYWDQAMLPQTTRRSTIPAHYSTGALEPKIGDIREVLGRRAWTFRNQARMNLLLGLVRLRLNRQDDIQRWAVLIRDHLDAHGGRPAHPRRIEDPVAYNQAGERVYSLRG